LLKSRMRESRTYGSVRDVKQFPMVEYCDTLHIEREEKQGIQSIPKGRCYDIYSTVYLRNLKMAATFMKSKLLLKGYTCLKHFLLLP